MESLCVFWLPAVAAPTDSLFVCKTMPDVYRCTSDRPNCEAMFIQEHLLLDGIRLGKQLVRSLHIKSTKLQQERRPMRKTAHEILKCVTKVTKLSGPKKKRKNSQTVALFENNVQLLTTRNMLQSMLTVVQMEPLGIRRRLAPKIMQRLFKNGKLLLPKIKERFVGADGNVFITNKLA